MQVSKFVGNLRFETESSQDANDPEKQKLERGKTVLNLGYNQDGMMDQRQHYKLTASPLFKQSQTLSRMPMN